MKLLQKDKRNALHYNFYYYPTLLLAVAGILNTSYLAFAHYRNYTDLSWSSFCALSKSVNCDTVSQSPWSIFYGIPVAYWGLIGYTIYLFLLFSVRKNNPANVSVWALLLILGFLFSLTATVLGYISATQIGSYCILCLLSYLISFLLLLYAWITWRRFGYDSFNRGLIDSFTAIKKNYVVSSSLAIMLGAIVLLKLLLPHYWLYDLNIQTAEIQTGYTIEGHPWFGAENPRIIIEEFSDYQCFQCYKTHFAIRRIIEQNPDKIRLVHRHYPLDHEFNPIASPDPFHIGSGRMALLSIAAAAQNKFWEVNDLIFQEMRKKKEIFNFEEIVNSTGLAPEKLKKDYFSQESLKILESDIRAGLKYNITSTPTFVVDGKTYSGNIPFELIENIIAD